MLDRITPIILTYNETPNIGRCLDQLKWAGRIIVVDSNSTDETPAIVARYSNTQLVQRAFDDHESQWRFAVGECGEGAKWILRLDADYILTKALIAEIQKLDPGADIGGYRIGFTYCIHGRPLRGSLYPSNVVLFRQGQWTCRQDGHTERWAIDGHILPLRGRILHDDRKPIRHWVDAQQRYLALERDKLLASDPNDLDVADRLRRQGYVAPILMLFYCLFYKGLILDGRAGLFYTFQRTFAETLLSLYILERRLSKALE